MGYNKAYMYIPRALPFCDLELINIQSIMFQRGASRPHSQTARYRVAPKVRPFSPPEAPQARGAEEGLKRRLRLWPMFRSESMPAIFIQGNPIGAPGSSCQPRTGQPLVVRPLLRPVLIYPV